MIGNPKLFGRVVSLEILPRSGVGKEFTYPPFDIEFETEIGPMNLTTVKIYNVNEDTMNLVGAKSKGSGFQYPSASLSAGYKDKFGVVANGEVIRPQFKQEETNKILEFKISANAASWASSYIMKTYSNLPAMTVILDIIKQGNLKPGRITLGENKIVNFSANVSLGDCIQKFCKLTKSQYWFQDGFLYVDTLSPDKKPSRIFLDDSSGLIGVPEKGQKTWKIKSLFRHQFKKNVIVSVKGGGLNGDCRIEKGKHVFSTFQTENYSELEVMPL
ncbi:phage protein [Leptospira yasudae]|uniref:Uncharacterized protein n=1 Tax=Leptospira yasudae TaxID=2202201 RepID=A0A6N4QYY9_9LEPT|nr:hypothetical protein [Leptospira yasudae]TGL77337.1 hypothetical protein EHQ77_15935 [Leptospira yasudae]TGL78082.1 hypothetical protein EHQ72_10555 [Leptospira yasudae]TGL87101.1 hypothetical protein EHQ83_04880 [Leptospira yasudae]